jgi:calcineurin-like phosphoesterase family protein
MNLQKMMDAATDGRKVFFTSDTHFGHAKMADTRWMSLEDMDRALIDNWNGIVTDDDLVIHLGDIAFKRPMEYIDKLKGELLIIRGNHDGSLPATKLDIITEFRGTIFGRQFHLYHYPILDWDRKKHGSIHLHGHTHGGLIGKDTGIDIGSDCWALTPVSFDSVLKEWEIRYAEIKNS